MSEVRQTKLPGVGIRYEFTTTSSQDIGVIVHHDGRREILVYDGDDPDTCTSVVNLHESDTQTLAEILGVSHVTETVAAVRQEIEGLAIDWLELVEGSPAVGTSIGDGEYRTNTGVSIVAVIRNTRPIPAPGPDFVFSTGDVAVAVGTSEGLAALQKLLGPATRNG